ncbi:MAG: hypothetical protein ABIF19_17135 [Planctomycetota bacterium]|uniref:Tail protein n=1 Tax=viral metagenome TaxID=1070528 RepID=A0A6M3L538_9ZZZZ
MIDCNAVLVEWLKTTATSLYTLVATRVYCPALPPGFTNTQAALEVMRRGGRSALGPTEHAPSFQIKCFGGTDSHAQAEAVYQALYDRLHGQEGHDVTSGNVMSAEEETIGQSLFDPVTKWPFVLTFWNVTMRPKT